VENEPKEERTDAELAALRTIVGAMATLDDDARQRVIEYLKDRYGDRA
jgi:hypothetical protein